MNEDLKWLAENVHEWPTKIGNGFVNGAMYYGPQSINEIVYCKGGITRAQWQAARDALGLNHSVEPTEKVWRGPEDGLPPVGIKCEFTNGDNYWMRVFTVGLDADGHMVVQTKNDGYLCSLSPTHFRPIRSKEDRAVEEMLEVCKQCSVS